MIGKVRADFIVPLDLGFWDLPEFMRESFIEEYIQHLTITIEAKIYALKCVSEER